MDFPRFGVTHPVPVNLLMAALLIGGVYSALTVTREFFPDITPEQASINLPYPGATPEEVEEGLAIKVEDAIADLDEVEEIRTTLAEGGGGIIVKFYSGVAIDKAVDEVERAVDLLTDLPDEAENIEVVEFEPRMPVIMVTVYGDSSEGELKSAIQDVKDDLKTLPDMGEVLIAGVRNYEVRVDVAYTALLEHGISLPDVAEKIRSMMAEVPGGSVRTDGGSINVRTLGVPERAQAIRDIVIKATEDGQSIRVADIATVKEDFVDQQLIRRFNGKSSATLIVMKVGDQDAVDMAEMVRAYVAGRRSDQFEPQWKDKLLDMVGKISAFFASKKDDSTESNLENKNPATKRKQAYLLGLNSSFPLPGNIETHSDLARFIEGRLSLLTRNALWGAILVFSTLLFFLNWRVAFWVGIGLAIALSGTLLLMSSVGITLNLLTMFGLIVVLGLLVDDAIVVAENIQHRHDSGEPSLQAAIRGTNQVFWPVVATVLTSIVAFMPLTFIQGRIGDLLGALPIVVACALMMSLLESVLILPSHMGHSLIHRDKSDLHKHWKITDALRRFEKWRDSLINNKLVPAFGRLLNLSLRFRYVSIAVALAVLIGTFGFVAGGQVGFTFMSSSDSETVIVDIRMPIGVPIEQTEEVVKAIEDAAHHPSQNGEIKSTSATVGESQNVEAGTRNASASHVAQIFIELVPIDERDRESASIIDAIRKLSESKTIAAESVKYSEISGGMGGADLTFEVTGENSENVEAVVAEIKAGLYKFDGVKDITDDNFAGQREVQIVVTPGGAALGFNNQNVASQIRGALFGIDAHVFSAKREDIDVRVRLSEDTRRDLHAIENLWVISPAGNTVPLVEIANISEGSSYSAIRRIDRKRAVTVTADCDTGTNPEEVVKAFPLNDIVAQFPDVDVALGGRQRNMSDAFASLPLGFGAALVLIYVILAWLFSSYTQPIAVMLAIPFGLIGIIWGHFILGYEMTFLSLIGFVALSGIVVNDSLILVEYYNKLRSEGVKMREALVNAGMRRLRPIFLTTITTVLGLTPLMLETSFQAKFLIPMAISIAFGLMSATALILMVLPCILTVVEDFKNIGYYMWKGRSRPETALPHTKADLFVVD